MAEKDQQVYPMPQAKHDEEAAMEQSKELRHKKRMKCLAYVVAFAVFQTGIILLFTLTVMKIRTPKFRVRSATFETFDVVTTPTSFNIKMNAELGVKNTNFGHYKFDNSTITFFYKGTLVGSTVVSKARARARSTKKFNIVVDLISTNLPNTSDLENDINSGFLPLSSESTLRGKVELFKVYPMPQANGPTKHDEEAATVQSEELRRKKRMKYLAYGVAFVVFQTGIILIFALTVMKIKTPKFRFRSATFENFDVVAASPSFNIKMNAEVGVKNTNFGHYKFDNSTITFFYKGTPVGSAIVPNGRARARSTKKFNIVVDLISTSLPSTSELGNDIGSGVLLLSSQSTLRGKVELFKVMKKKKSTQMDCSMTINLGDRTIEDLKCK
ncbi:hypothetical protein F0562_026668 [Nyssa sinensis]|uniref:Late embryogenesis abundant protein LEA-2 subgroup domain-containing protein n=1 Tax=Nyssa sinensis TaxID=561372 RepID=A0A5J5BBZ2_9ASTE|nr:hypothetical protein F0562_026668 [Nyssa sinensis]